MTYIHEHGSIRESELYGNNDVDEASVKDGKGNPYADRIRMHMPLLGEMQSASAKAFMRTFNS